MLRAALIVLAVGCLLGTTGCSKSSTETSMADKSTTADNTALNERDRGDSLPTPLDQGENEADRTITQAIRQAVMDNGTLSMDAKNVKIITSAGIVTLRGPVESEAERTFIVQVAQQTPGVTRVDDMLEVAVKTGS